MVKKAKPKATQEQINMFERMAHGMQDKTPEEQDKRLKRIAFYSKQDQKVVDVNKEYETGIPAEPWNEAAEKSFQASLDKIRKFFVSDEYSPIKEMLPGSKEWFFEVKSIGITAREIIELGDFIDQLSVIMPLIQKEIELYKKENGIEELTFSEFISSYDPEKQERKESIFYKVYKRAREKAPDKELYPIIKSGLPGKLIMPNDAFTNMLGGTFDRKTGKFTENIKPKGTENGIDVTYSNKGTKITAYTIITQENSVTFESVPGRQFTRYDRCVFNAFATLYQHEPRDVEGYKHILPEKIYRTMENKDPSFYVHPEQIEPIITSIEKMRGIKIFADVTPIYKTLDAYKDSFKKIPDLKFIFDNYLIVAEGETVKAGNQSKKAYRINTEPLLLRHASALQQIFQVNSYLLDIKSINDNGTFGASVKNSPKRRGIVEYLLTRIEYMKKDLKEKGDKYNPAFRKIMLDTLYRECDIDTTQRRYTQTAREFIFQVLDFWKTLNPQYIKSYLIEKHGKKIISITIEI